MCTLSHDVVIQYRGYVCLLISYPTCTSHEYVVNNHFWYVYESLNMPLRKSTNLHFTCPLDSPGCECGFMSVERMRILLSGLDSVGYGGIRDSRQQITPDMKFTCDGMITKWIIGAWWWWYLISRATTMEGDLIHISEDKWNTYYFWDRKWWWCVWIWQLFPHPIPSWRHPGSVYTSRMAEQINTEIRRWPWPH